LVNFREKHKRYTPDPITGGKQRKRKHKRKSLDMENSENHAHPEVHRRITIKVIIIKYYYKKNSVLFMCYLTFIFCLSFFF
jgi:hypothetical protein